MKGNPPDTTEKTIRCTPTNWLEPNPVQSWFDTEQPLTIDLGCGKGRFLLAHATRNPDRNILGVERQLVRIRKMDRKALRANLTNVRLLRLEAYYFVRYLVPPESVDRYIVYFPDPWPKERHERHRLFSPAFLEALHRTLQPGGEIHFATDHLPYYYPVRQLLLADTRFDVIPAYEPHEDERTDFELLFRDTKSIGRWSLQKRA